MYSLSKLLLAASLALQVGTAAAAPAAPHPAKKPFPTQHLNQPVRGEAAVRALGASLPEVAAWYGKSTAEFARLLRQDPDLWLDTNGRAHFIEEGMAAAEEGALAEGAAAELPALAPLSQTFLLHSRPGASRTIYLEFHGGAISGTAWNNSYGLALIDAKPYDTDGNAAALSDTELLNIQYIWQRVAEDYAPFDINVTTEQPAADALSRTSGTDTTFGTRVMVARDWTSSTTKPCNCGGFAYISSYDDTSEFYKPAWVFFDKLGNGNPKYVAEAISHEVGHNLGLYHDGYNDGTTQQGYFAGYGSGATGWAPIMGVGYYKELTQWSKGEYAYSSNTEDDLAIIQNNGGTLRVDDHGNDMAGASALGAVTDAGTVTLSGSGVISTRTDIDVFRFASGNGTITINLLPFERGPNLDINLGLYDANGTLLASANPADSLVASLSLPNAVAGTYYVRVDGVGRGDPATGYSDYASLGYYAISGSAPAADGAAPVAALSADKLTGPAPLTVNFSSAGSYDPDGGSLSYLWNFGDGSTSTSASPSHAYSTVGSYVALLTVTDSSGASDTAQATLEITAPPPPPQPAMHVENIAMALVKKAGKAQATATITLLDANGKVIKGATVTGSWSGVVSGSVSGTTNRSGVVKFSSPLTSQAGTFTFTVNGASVAGYSYDASQNKETSDSIGYAPGTMAVSDITMQVVAKQGQVNAVATVTLRDADNRPVKGAVLEGMWSGAVSGNARGTTNKSGQVKLASAKVAGGGTFTFSVTGASLANHVYAAERSLKKDASITR